ncbi:hypothetical protein [Flavobacterium sp.]|uniref:hypothetical protein n=1 Tax=Flavobacterium sp. TaxID=239 RepID=UPI0039E6ECBE
MQKNKLLLLFPDGVGIRNYLYSRVFDDADAELVLMHNFSPDTITYLRQLKDFSQEVSIPDYTESAKERFLRELICLCRLRYNARMAQNPEILYNWNTKHKGFSKRLFYKAIERLAPFYRSYDSILKLETAYQKALRKNPFYAQAKILLEQIKPDRVFCLHQRGLKMPTIFAAAQDLGIPSATVIYSWDNLPKARMALLADRYLVWSTHMKNEIQTFYPEIPENQVQVTGTPQFEFYQYPEYVMDRNEFFAQYQLDPDKKIICFSGDDETTSPDDAKYLEDLAEAVADSELKQQYQILVRRCPVDFSGRYQSIIEKHGDLLKEAPPLWNFGRSAGWSEVYPLYEDVRLLVSTVYYCDMVVNLGSTMAFDFSMFDKPCLFLNYNQPNRKDPNWSVEKVYRFQHFRTMPDQAVFWLNGKEEIVQQIRTAAAKGMDPDMKRWSQVILEDHQKASQNIKRQINPTQADPVLENK